MCYVICFASIAVVVTSAAAQENRGVENPDYTSWAKHKPGTQFVQKMTGRYGEKTVSSHSTLTLLDVSPTRVLVENKDVMHDEDVGESRSENKTTRPRYLSTVEKPAEEPEGTYEQGTEELRVAGKVYKARWYKYRREEPSSVWDATVWRSPEIPVALKLRATITSKNGSPSHVSTTELVEVKLP